MSRWHHYPLLHSNYFKRKPLNSKKAKLFPYLLSFCMKINISLQFIAVEYYLQSIEIYDHFKDIKFSFTAHFFLFLNVPTTPPFYALHGCNKTDSPFLKNGSWLDVNHAQAVLDFHQSAEKFDNGSLMIF